VRRRWAAATFDSGVALAIALLVFAASGHFWVPLGVAMLAYHLGGVLLLGNTPGVCLWAPEPDRPGGGGGTGTAPRFLSALERLLTRLRPGRDAAPPAADYVTTRG